MLSAEEIVRFTHNPRMTGFATLEGDRAEVLEIEVSPGSSVLGLPFHTHPFAGAIVGAIVRGDAVVFPRRDDALMAGDRAIIFADSRVVAELEQSL